MNNGARLKGVAIGVSSRLQLSVTEVIPVDERIMQLRLKHTLGFMFLVAVYAPTEVSEADEKEMFYAKLDCSGSVPPCQDTLIVLGDFNAVTGIERVMCWSP